MTETGKVVYGKEPPTAIMPRRSVKQCQCGTWFSVPASNSSRYSACSTLCDYSKRGRAWTDDQIQQLRTAYEKANSDPDYRLAPVLELIGKGVPNAARKARQLGLTNQRRRKVSQLKPIESKARYASKEERSRALSEMMALRHKQRPHPMRGRKHTESAKAAISSKSKAAWRDPASGLNSEQARQKRSDLMLKKIVDGQMNTGYSRTKGGKRDDLGGIYFRSAWEANYARYLNFLKARGQIHDWKFEPRTFVFESIKRGTRAYTPDFQVFHTPDSYEWHEVKGWMDDKSKVRLKRFAKYYPKETLVLIDRAWFRSAQKNGLGSLVSEHWEHGSVR